MFDRLKTAPFRGWRVLTCDESPARCNIVQYQQPNEDDEATTSALFKNSEHASSICDVGGIMVSNRRDLSQNWPIT